MIDLHMHTNFSDGTDTVTEILKKAEEKKLEYISITDHNTCAAYNELNKIDIKKYYSGKIIKGVELTTKLNGISIEILGYDVKPEIINKETEIMYKKLKNKNHIELESLKKICKKLNIHLSEEITEDYDNTKYKYASSYVHEQIVKHPENRRFFITDEGWNDPMEFYRKEISNKKSHFYIDNTQILPTIEEVIKTIKKAGGLVFIPHIYQYGNNTSEIFKEINEKYKVDGYECFYPKFSNEQTKYITEFCQNNNLYMSGGSDYHGKTKPNIDIGTGINNNLNIKLEIIKPWVKLLKNS